MKDTRRIFIAIPLPPDARSRIRETLARWQWLSVRWIPEVNWHMTLIPPFSAANGEFSRVRDMLARAAAKEKSFSVTLDAITLAPAGKRARMIWVSGPRLQRLQGLRELVEREFAFEKVSGEFQRSLRSGTPHITVARFQEGALSGLEEKTHVLQKVDVPFLAREFAVMESQTFPSGAEYKKLAAFSFR